MIVFLNKLSQCTPFISLAISLFMEMNLSQQRLINETKEDRIIKDSYLTMSVYCTILSTLGYYQNNFYGN